MRLLLALVSGLAGCSFSAPEGGSAFACSAEAPDCPAGTTCIDGRCREPADAAPPPAGFRFRQKLTFGNRDGETVAGAPVLVLLDPGVFDPAAAQADGADLRFFDIDGAPLPHEIERWDPAGRSLLWVKVPEVTGGSDADYIWLYYGHDDPPPLANADVWSAYQAVYHLAGHADDSAALMVDGDLSGPRETEGRIGSGLLFDGTADHVVIGPDPPLLRGVRAMSLEAWIRPERPPGPGDQVVVAVSADGGDFSRAQIKIDPTGKVRAVFRTEDTEAGSAVHTLDAVLPQGLWTWVVVGVDLAEQELRVVLNGGESVGSLANLSLGDSTAATTPDRALISIDETGAEWFAGTIDEVRIAGQAMSSDWIALQYASMTGQLISFGAAEPL
ncbi:MAG TPA: DUF2341 domain-containing protein [Kofleriaceae bacterium]|nr:DUF2341 domain-containing protein [Kofleriaceae bacterium]